MVSVPNVSVIRGSAVPLQLKKQKHLELQISSVSYFVAQYLKYINKTQSFSRVDAEHTLQLLSYMWSVRAKRYTDRTAILLS